MIGWLFRLISQLWNGLGRIRALRPLWRPLNEIFDRIAAVWRIPPLRWIPNLLVATVCALDRNLRRSRYGRRTFFLLLCATVACGLHPPSHWGPWHHYQTGIASHYGWGFYLRKTANREWFLPFYHTAAHRTLPLGITAKVVNLENGKTVYVRINDRGPYVEGRILDLSTSAGKAIGLYGPGTAKVAIYVR
jgi:hypothetical protein